MRPSLLLPVCLACAALTARSGAAADPPLAPTTAAATARPKLTLPELIRMARERSPIVAAAHSQIAVRQMQKREADWNWFPSGDVTLGVTLVPEVECQPPGNVYPAGLSDAERQAYRRQNCVNTINTKSGQPISNTSTFDVLGSLRGAAGELNVRLTQPLYTFGKIEHASAAASAGIDAERARTDGARLETELQVQRAYWGLKTARASRATAGEARGELARWVDRMQEDVDADAPKYNFSQTDLARIKVALAQIDIVLADLDRSVAIAENGLRTAVGADVEIDDEELEPVSTIERPLVDYQREALLHRPEVHALEAGVRLYRELQEYQLSQMLPDLALATSFIYRFAPTIEGGTNAYLYQPNLTGFGFALALRQPLDLFVRHSRLARARAEADAFGATRRLALAGVSFEIAQAHATVTESRRRMQQLDRSQRVAQGWLSSAEQKLDAGLLDSATGTRELVDAARAYFELRLRYYQSIMDVNVSCASLRRATGVDVAR